MSERDALYQAILAAPDDDAPRLVLADWLDEHGDGLRAEFIRVQCELARRESPALRAREAELLERHHDDLAGPLAVPGLSFRFNRGFAVGFGHSGLFVEADARSRSHRSVLRFFPTGQIVEAFVRSRVTTTFTSEALDEVARGAGRWHGRWCVQRNWASYRADALVRPGRLRLTMTWGDRGTDDFGDLAGPDFFPEILELRTGRYFHVPMNNYGTLTHP